MTSAVSCNGIWTRDIETKDKKETTKPPTDNNKQPTNPQTKPQTGNNNKQPTNPQNPVTTISTATLWKPKPTNSYWPGENIGNFIIEHTCLNILVANYNRETWFKEQTKNLNVNYDISMPQKMWFYNGSTYDINYTAKPGYKFDNGLTTFNFKWVPTNLEESVDKLHIDTELKQGFIKGSWKMFNGLKYRSVNLIEGPNRSIHFEVFDQDKNDDDLIEENGIIYAKQYSKQTKDYVFWVKPKKGFYFSSATFKIYSAVNYIKGGILLSITW